MRLCVHVRAFVSMCAVPGSRLLYLHVWSEHLSSSSRRCKPARQAGAAAAALRRERDSTHFQTFCRSDIKRFLNAFTWGEAHTLHTHAQMQTDSCSFTSCFVLLAVTVVVFSYHSPCHTQTPSASDIGENTSRILVQQ